MRNEIMRLPFLLFTLFIVYSLIPLFSAHHTKGHECYLCSESVGCYREPNDKSQEACEKGTGDMCAYIKTFQEIYLGERRCFSNQEMDCYKAGDSSLNITSGKCFNITKKLKYCSNRTHHEAEKKKKQVECPTLPTTTENGTMINETTSASLTASSTGRSGSSDKTDTIEICVCEGKRCNSENFAESWNSRNLTLIVPSLVLLIFWGITNNNEYLT